MTKVTSKEINAAAHAHAKLILGEDQAKSNKDAVKGIAEDFKAGVKWLKNISK